MPVHVPTNYEVETFSGRFVDTGAPTPESICIEDIAHALSSICRFGGHSKRFYSVAEHAVFVSRRLEEEYPEYFDLAMQGLHHDDAEGYLGDIPRPLKALLQPIYGLLSKQMDEAIAIALHLPMHGEYASLVKEADNFALLVEANHLMPSHGINWEGSDMVEVGAPPTPDYWLGGLKPWKAEELYLTRHKELSLWVP
jgi:hypothetical protein